EVRSVRGPGLEPQGLELRRDVLDGQASAPSGGRPSFELVVGEILEVRVHRRRARSNHDGGGGGGGGGTRERRRGGARPGRRDDESDAAHRERSIVMRLGRKSA